MEPKKLLTILTFVMVVLFTGCKKDDFVEKPGVCPIVESTDPVNVAAGVSVKKVITATFNEEMDPATINSTSFTITGATKGESLSDGVVTYSGMTATFTPSSQLVANTTYTGTIKKTAKDLKGLFLQADYVWTFSTAVAPTVTLVDPLNLATSVALNKVVTATFSEAMDPLTVTASTFTLMNGAIAVPGVVVCSGTTATFTPGTPLLLGKTYTATINTNAKSAAGVVLANNYIWTFSTGALIAPTVTSTDPLSLATNVALNKVVTANFSVAMDPLTVIGANFKLMDGLNPVAGAVTYSGTTATFTPSAALTLGKTYTATITNSVKNVAGTPMLNNYVWAFSTGAVVAPTVILTDPLDLAINVPLIQAVNATFSVPMNAATITTSTFTLMDGLTPVNGVVTYSGNVATFTPVPALTGGKTYTATITNGAKDPSGTALTANYVWSFSTPPLYALTVVATNGSVVKNPDQVSYLSGSSVVLTATPNTGYSFTSWSGDATGNTNPLTVNMNAAKNITANFTINSYSLNVSAANGSVVKNPDQLTYDYGTIVDLTATPASGYAFTSWSGDLTSTVNPRSILIDGNKNVTANFSLLSAVCTPAVDLGLSGDYVIFAQSGISTTGTTSIVGDMGISPAEDTYITGFGLILPAGGSYSTSSLVTGKIYAPSYAAPTPANLTTTTTNMSTAFTTGNGLAPNVTELMAGDLNGQTLAPGVYKWGTGLSITNGITLDGGGDPCASFVFQVAGDLTVANSAIITLANGADAKHIFWIVAGSKADLGTGVDFSGNILCKTLISLNTGAKVLGRLLAQTAVTLNASTVTMP